MYEYRTVVKVWLLVGLFMVFMQIVIGGITRLTGSGLSITKWEIVTGTIPPLNQADWNREFDLYKETPQYQKINRGMSISQFKFIYFWEYFHRLWARSMGLIFIIPFLYFWRKGYLDKPLMRRLGFVVLFAAIVALFGWIMVASGLNERPWVNAYKLTIHLSLALIVFGYLFYAIFKVYQKRPPIINVAAKKWIKIIGLFLILQILLGGMMSGMKAALTYPTWPDMNGQLIPDVLLSENQWVASNFIMYDQNTFMPALIQFGHRMTGYILFGLLFAFLFIRKEDLRLKRAALLMIGMGIVQMLLGILTVIQSKGMIPIGLGVYHQSGAILLLLSVLYTRFLLK